MLFLIGTGGVIQVTNFERIRAMSIDEMAVMLADEIPHGDCSGCYQCVYLEKPDGLRDKCQGGWLEWLESEET